MFSITNSADFVQAKAEFPARLLVTQIRTKILVTFKVVLCALEKKRANLAQSFQRSNLESSRKASAEIVLQFAKQTFRCYTVINLDSANKEPFLGGGGQMQ